jgi:hypothetical protein
MNKRMGLGAVLFLAACGGSPTTTTDAAISVPDTGPAVDSGVACANHIPNPDTNPDERYGTSEGRQFRPFTLPTCDNTPYDFYGEDYCQATTRLTVLSIAAEWCAPCQAESSMLMDRIVVPYGDQVRVIQVVVQNASHGPADAALCQRWTDTYGLENVELYDAEQITNSYFPAGSLPSTVIIDNTGTIVYYENGAVDGLTTLTDQLDLLLGR